MPQFVETEVTSPLVYLKQVHGTEKKIERVRALSPQVARKMEETVQLASEEIVREAKPQPGDRWLGYAHFEDRDQAWGGLKLLRGKEVVYQKVMWGTECKSSATDEDTSSVEHARTR